MTIIEKLDRLHYLKTKNAAAAAEFEAVKAAVLALHQDELERAESYAEKIVSATRDEMDSLETGIKADVLSRQVTVRGAHLQAVYSRGRVSWDSKTLDGYALSHPEILAARTEGKPSVAFREIK